MASPGDTISTCSAVKRSNAGIDDHGPTLEEIGSTLTEWDVVTVTPISSVAHDDTLTAVTSTETTSIASVEDEKNGESNYEQKAALLNAMATDVAAGRLLQTVGRGCIATAKFECITQRHGCAEVRVGWGDEIPRWRLRSEVTYVICVEMFPALLLDIIIDAMTAAIGKWQADSFVRFKQVDRADHATFAVTYESGDGGAYARSFFPNESRGAGRKLVVFAKTLQVRDCLVNILAHEVGHILGFRHEFAQVDKKERKYRSALIGEEDAQSVMNYFEHPSQLQVQKRDIEGLRTLYGSDRTEYEGMPVRDIDPETSIFASFTASQYLSSVDSVAAD
ncbi:hypothetical protein V8C35DRAFT_180 [Trichoderma chlorosporum]